MSSDLSRLQRSLSAILSSSYERVTGAHWPATLASGADLESFDSSLSFVCSLSPAQHWTRLARYFWQQPGFLRDLLRYDRAARRTPRS